MKLLSAVYDYGKNEKSVGLSMKWRKKYFKKTRKEKKKQSQEKNQANKQRQNERYQTYQNHF